MTTPEPDIEKSKLQLEALRRAKVALKEAEANLADQMQRSQDVTSSSTMAAEQYYTVTKRVREALIEQLEAQLQSAKAGGKYADQLEEIRQKLNDVREAGVGFVDVAGAIQERVNGMWGVTQSWTSDIAASMAAAAGSGQNLGSIFREISDNAETAATRQAKWGSRALKLTEGVNAGFATVLQKSMSLVGAIDAQESAFKSATGASQKYVSMIAPLENKFYHLGLSMEESAALMGSLYSSMTGFTRMSPASQEAVKDITAVLQTMGVEGATTAQNMEIMTRSMGMTGTQAANVTGQLFTLASRLDISTNKMMEDFTRLGPQLVVHGKQAVQVFIQLEAAAKESGMEVDKMLGIARKFDQFSTAADSVGQLNAVLGGPYLSVMRMVEATNPTERMKMLAAATRSAGLEFNTMGYYQRQAVAGAMGLSDVNDLALVMRGRFNLVSDSVSMTSSEIEKLAQENRDYKDVQAELQQALRAFAVPLTKVLQSISHFLEYVQSSPNAVMFLVSAVVSLKGAMMGLNLAATMASAGMVTFGGAMGPLIMALAAGGAAFSALHIAMSVERHSPPLFAEKGGLMQVAAGQVYGMAGALGQLVSMAISTAPALAGINSELHAMPTDKVLNIRKVFTEQEKVLDASKGANITRHTIDLLGHFFGGQMAGRPINVHVDSTLEVDGRTLAIATARQLSDSVA